jgi:hypothetical protein
MTIDGLSVGGPSADRLAWLGVFTPAGKTKWLKAFAPGGNIPGLHFDDAGRHQDRRKHA